MPVTKLLPRRAMLAGLAGALAGALAACTGVDPTTAPGARTPTAPATPTAPTTPLADSAASHVRWSDPAVWPDGHVPVAGDDVTIPAGRIVALDVATPVLGAVRIDGTLTFVDGASPALSAHAVTVRGAMEIGTETQPFAGAAAITLIGSPDDVARFGVATKAIVVDGGRFDVHGAPAAAWTRLAATAPAGATRLALTAPVAWHAGDRIVVASTDYEPSHAEEAIVVGVDGASVSLDRALAYTHWGTLQTFAGRTLDERAEVGRLTRNVVIAGDVSSAVDGFGGHLMILPGSTVRLEDVELHRMGQRGRMARYPIHWHLAREAEGSYARRVAVWQSYNRCVTIHGTNAVRLEDNVCYDHVGHGYFFEDGVEERNVLRGNLGLRTRVPDVAARLLQSDARAATFWVTNPNNDLRDNVAAGGDGFGLWYAFAEHPSGLSATTAVWPRRTPLGRFEGNRAHSNVLSGLWVDEGTATSGASETTFYTPMGPDGASTDAVFRGLQAYKNRQFGAWLRGSALRLTEAVLADNMVGAAFAAVDATLEDGLVVGKSANAGSNPDAWSPTHGFWYYDGRVGVRRTTFARFVPDANDDARALAFFPSNPWPIDATNYASDLTFVDAARLGLDRPAERYDGTKSAVVVDADGTLTGARGASVVPDVPFLVDESCARRTDWSGWVCGTRMAQLHVRTVAGTIQSLTARRDDGATTAVAPVAYDRAYASLTIPVGRAITLAPQRSASGALALQASGLRSGDVLDVAFPLGAAPARVRRATTGASDARQLAPVALDAIARCAECYAYDAASGLVRVRTTAGSAGEPIVVAEP